MAVDAGHVRRDHDVLLQLSTPRWVPQTNPHRTRVSVVAEYRATHHVEVDGKPVALMIERDESADYLAGPIGQLPTREGIDWKPVKDAAVAAAVTVGVTVVALCALRVVALTFNGQ